jgi:hypothetical protein
VHGTGLQLPLACSLVAGFLLIRLFPLTRYYTNRQQGYALFLSSITAGLFLLIIASAVVHYARNWQIVDVEAAHRFIHAVLPVPHAGKSLVALIIGVVLPVVSWLVSLDAYMNFVIEMKGDPLEVLLRRAFGQSREVSVTLRSGKAYVGRIADLFNPSYDVQYIELFLTHSGYRTETEKRLVLPNDYREKTEEVYTQRLAERVRFYAHDFPEQDFDWWLAKAEGDLVQQTGIERELSAYQVVIPTSEVVSVSYFDHELYEMFKGDESSVDSTTGHST